MDPKIKCLYTCLMSWLEGCMSPEGGHADLFWAVKMQSCVNDAVTCQGKWNQMKSNEGKELYYMILSWKVITFEVLLIIISIRILSLWRCFQTFSLMYKDWYLNKYVFHVKPPLEIHFTQLKKVIIFKCQLNNRGVQITEPIHQANYTAVMEPYRMWPDWQIHEAMIGF